MSDSPTRRSQPPKKVRDPALMRKSSGSLRANRKAYVRATVASAATNVFERGDTSVRVKLIKGNQKRIKELSKWTGQDRQQVLNSALTYAASLVTSRQSTMSDLRSRVRESVGSSTEIPFTPTAASAKLLLGSGARDARYVLLNAGIKALHARLRP